jgi:hypothetical protein
MLKYYGAVWRIAVRDARAFWTAHKIVTTVPATVIGLVMTIVVKGGLYSGRDVMETLAISALSFLGSLGLTFLVSAIKAPKLLDDERQTAMQNQTALSATQTIEIARLNQALAKPARTPVQEHHYELAKSALSKHGSEARLLLRHLRLHGTIKIGSGFVLTLPAGLNRQTATELLATLKNDHLVKETFVPSPNGTDSIWEIAPGMVEARDELLY